MLDRRDVHMIFQPVFDLLSGEIVAFEALARGPAGTQFASPFAMFTAAREAGRIAELDWVCRAAAFQAFFDADLPTSMSLFVNIEPEAIATQCPPDLQAVVARAESLLRVFVEVNDSALASDPAGVMVAVDRARGMGWGIAMDDVGSSRAPVAMLPIVNADLVKLDLRRLGETDATDAAAIISSVLRHVETSGATLLAEGIETEADATWARALGATYGQGHFLGLPGPLRDHYPAPRAPVRLLTVLRPDEPFDSTFELLGGLSFQRMTFEVFYRLVGVMAFSPRSAGSWPAYFIGLSRDGVLPPELVQEVGRVPQSTLMWMTFGTELSAEPVPGMRGVRLAPDDPLADERFFIMLSDHAPVAVFARQCPDGLYDVVVTQDRDVVHGAAHGLIRRIPSPGADNRALAVALVVDDAASDGDDRDGAGDGADEKRGWRRKGK